MNILNGRMCVTDGGGILVMGRRVGVRWDLYLRRMTFCLLTKQTISNADANNNDREGGEDENDDEDMCGA